MDPTERSGDRVSNFLDGSKDVHGPKPAAPAIFEVDLDGNFLSVTPEFLDLTGFTDEELKLLSIHNLTFLEDRGKVGSVISSIKDGAQLMITEIVVFSEFRGSRPVEMIMVPRMEAGGLVSVFGAFRDIERRRSLENELRVVMEKQDASQRFLTEFVSLLTREIRQPLTTIMLTLEMLDSGSFGDLNDVQNDKVSQLIEIIDRLKLTLNEALEMSRNIGEKIDLDRKAFPLEDLIETVLDSRVQEIRTRSIQIRKSFPEERTGPSIDRKAILQVISALVDRALSHSPDGGQIVLELEEKEGEVAFSISDSGEGIPEEQLRYLFDKLQVDSDIENKHFAEGLNLYMAKRVIKSHGGSIWCESFVGIGSIFFFVIPVEQDREAQK